MRNRLGLARKVRPGAVRSTMFDRAASRGGSGGATVAAGAVVTKDVPAHALVADTEDALGVGDHHDVDVVAANDRCEVVGERYTRDAGDGIAILTINRPEKKNALTDAMYRALADALEASDEDRETRVVLLRGEGDMFTAGNDIADFVARASQSFGEAPSLRFIRQLAVTRTPMVAAVDGLPSACSTASHMFATLWSFHRTTTSPKRRSCRCVST